MELREVTVYDPSPDPPYVAYSAARLFAIVSKRGMLLITYSMQPAAHRRCSRPKKTAESCAVSGHVGRTIESPVCSGERLTRYVLVLSPGAKCCTIRARGMTTVSTVRDLPIPKRGTCSQCCDVFSPTFSPNKKTSDQ